MDPRSTEQHKEELIARLAASRIRIASDQQRLRDQLNPLLRVRAALKEHPLRAFGLAAGGAFVVSLLRRRSSSSRPLTLKRLLLNSALGLAKPAVRLWLLNQAKEHFLPTNRREATDPSPAKTP